MADSTDTATSPPSGGGSSNKLTRFIKKNKTLSAVIGVVGGYLAYKQLKKGQEGGAEYNGEEVSGSETGPYPGGPVEATEVSHEAIDEEIADVRDELKTEREEREEREREIERENEDKGEGGGSGETQPGGGDKEPTTETAPPASGVNIHGRNFPGATSSHIASMGQDGNKHYVEYAIVYPGRQEHWRYYTASGNWKQVKNSGAGPGANKPDKPAKPKPPGQGVTGGGSNGGTTRPKQNVAPARPVASPPDSGEKQKARNEISRLQNEIDGLQHHIQQLTDTIQAHPKAQQRGQWENERNADRSNIDHKRNEVIYWQART